MAGTRIKTREGSKNIEDIRCGDYVLAEDPETGELAYKEVVQTFVRDTDRIIHITADGDEIETTGEHPFWVEGKGFVNAGFLQQGDVLRLSTGENARVESVWEEVQEEKVLVYNFEVADFHTYFVSELGVLVHNVCSGGGKGSKHMFGSNGTQVSSKTTWKNGKTERIDVENPAPGERLGQVHYHDARNNKYYYDIDNNTFYDQKTGELAPKSIQKLLKDKEFMKGIKKALQVLGERYD